MPRPLPARTAGSLDLAAVSCSSASRCVAVGASGARRGVITVTVEGGRSWQTVSYPVPHASYRGFARFSGVACVRDDCWAAGTVRRAIGNQVVAEPGLVKSVKHGLSWSTEPLPAFTSRAGSMLAISCATPTYCLAAGTLGAGGTPFVIATDDGGKTWTRQQLPGQVTAVDAVSCPAVRACWAGGAGGTRAAPAGLVLRETSGRWTVVKSLFGTPVISIAFPDSTAGVVIQEDSGGGGCGGPGGCLEGLAYATATHGHTWSTQTLLGSYGGFVSLACATTKACWAVGDGVIDRS